MSVNNGGGGLALLNRGAWSGASAYNPGDVATNAGVGFLNYALVPAPTTPPTIDAIATHNNAVNTLTIAIPLVTTQTNEKIGLLVFIQQQLVITVLSVADTASLVWTKAWAVTGSNVDVEFWTAPTAALYNGTITATFSAATGGNSSASAVAFGVPNETGRDSNAGLPFHTTGVTALSVSTTQQPDMAIYAAVNSQSGGSPTLPAGFTQVAAFSNVAGLQNMAILIATEAIVGVWTNQAVQPAGGNVNNLNIVDAVTNSGAVNPAPASDPSHWVG